MSKILETNVITIADVNKNGKDWSTENDCEFHGVIPGFVCGWNVECEKDGKIDYCSMVCTNDYEKMIVPSYDDCDYNDLGISADLAGQNGWKPTGNIAFRGYFTEYYDYEYRDTFVKFGSEEAMKLFNAYCIA